MNLVKKKFVALPISAVLLCLVFAPKSAWAVSEIHRLAYQSELESMARDQWEAYGSAYADWQGGLAIRISSPQGDYFVQTGFDQPASPDTHFRGASTTKTFTAAAIMLLQQQGLLDIDDFVTDDIPGTGQAYLPDSSEYDIPFKSRITIRQLLQHRAGVFDVTNSDIPDSVDAPYAGMRYRNYVSEVLGDPYHSYTFDELTGVVADNGLYYFEPDAGFHYSNTGYGLLGKIIERISGLTYAEFVGQNLLEPNGPRPDQLSLAGNRRHPTGAFFRGLHPVRRYFLEHHRGQHVPEPGRGQCHHHPQ